MNPIYLSPRKLLSFLRDLEEKIPVTHNGAYIASDANGFKQNEDLEREAKNILTYVGLGNCVPKCKFEPIEGDYAGFTVNNMSILEIPITVNKKYIGDARACRAILSHEICHKVIYLNGIDFKYPMPKELNEIYTDLCTIFIGLGQVVLDGYIDSASKKLKMGYLEVDIYRQVFEIMARTTGKYKPLPNGVDLSDPLLEEALAIWGTPEEVKKLLRDAFIKNEQEIAEVNRNIILLQQILNQIYLQHGEIFRKLSKEAEGLGIFDALLSGKKMAIFSNVYESLFDHSDKEKFTVAQIGISNLILMLADEYKNVSLGALSYELLKCPNCGNESTTKIEDRDTIVKCKSCGIYFQFCNTHLNITKMRRHKDEGIVLKEKEAQEIQREWQRIAKARREVEIQEGKLSSKIKEAYGKGHKDGMNRAAAEKSEQYSQAISALPNWLRKLIGNRLPAEI